MRRGCPEQIERLLEEVPDSMGRGRALPARWYTEPSILEAEVAAVFRRSWASLQVQGVVESDGSHAADVIGGVPIVVVRDAEALSCHPVRVASWGPAVFANPDPDAPDFDELLTTAAARGIGWDRSPAPQHGDLGAERNWKLFYENVSECYHCPTVHPSFAAGFGVDPEEYQLEIRPKFIRHRTRQRADGSQPVGNWDAFVAGPDGRYQRDSTDGSCS